MSVTHLTYFLSGKAKGIQQKVQAARSPQETANDCSCGKAVHTWSKKGQKTAHVSLLLFTGQSTLRKGQESSQRLDSSHDGNQKMYGVKIYRMFYSKLILSLYTALIHKVRTFSIVSKLHFEKTEFLRCTK